MGESGADDRPGDAANRLRQAQLEAWLHVTLVPGIGGARLRRLLSAFGSPERVRTAARSQLTPLIGEEGASAIQQGAPSAQIESALRWLEQPGNRLLTLADEDYPPLLLQTADPPAVLYVRGRAELLRHPAIAIVGSRSPTAGGVSNAEAFAQALSEAGLTAISGLALGIDAAAHRGALRAVSSSVAVCGTGLDRVYPARNRELARQLAEQGALVSEFPLGTPPVASNFPRRNRIISGLSSGCLVVEAAIHSGSLITARQALDQGREVFAIPGSIHSPLAKGCHWLIKQGAKLVESAQDILEELGQPVPQSQRGSEPAPLRLTDEHQRVLAAMGFEPVDLDTLCARGGLTPDSASAMLLTLELEGTITRLPGGLFQRLR